MYNPQSPHSLDQSEHTASSRTGTPYTQTLLRHGRSLSLADTAVESDCQLVSGVPCSPISTSSRVALNSIDTNGALVIHDPVRQFQAVTVSQLFPVSVDVAAAAVDEERAPN